MNDVVEGACRTRAAPFDLGDDDALFESLVLEVEGRFDCAHSDLVVALALAEFDKAAVRSFVPILAKRRALEIARAVCMPLP